MNKLFRILFGAFVCYSPMAHAQNGVPIQKKIIEVGWDEPDSARLRENLKQMEQTPFDGVTISAHGISDDGKTIRVQNTFSDMPWKKEWFQDCVDNLKAVHSARLTDNFIHVGCNPGNVDWFDDAGWKEVVDHWRIAAWIAREGNLKGILFDPTTYTKPYKQFQYIRQPDIGDHTFAQYQAKARQRGREVISAVATIDPNCVIFTFYMNSMQAASRAASFDLYPAFINGWLDGAPPTIIFVDGNSAAYHYNSQKEFLNAANQVRNGALCFMAPENRRKYAAQVQTAFGLYLDAHVNPATSSFYIDPKGSSRTERMKINATYAANAATEYIWCYGEHYRWWPTPGKNINQENWEDKLPGITKALLHVVHS